MFVFVYGTLKPGGRYHQQYCGRALIQAIPAIAKGRLYDFPQWGYPAMTAGDDWVKGYLLVFEPGADTAEILQQLDYLEGVGDNQADSYQRFQQLVFTPNYEPLQTAWVYRMTPAQVHQFKGVYISSGDWL